MQFGKNQFAADTKRAAIKKFVDEAPQEEIDNLFEDLQLRLMAPPSGDKPPYDTGEYWTEIERRDKEMDENPAASLTWEQVRERVDELRSGKAA